TYERTTGCCGIEGPNYAIKMSALLFLRALDTRKTFHIASNFAEASTFDDVVLKLGDSTYLLQLNHKIKSQTVLNLRQLVQDKDFKLNKYLESLLEIKNKWETNDDLKKSVKFAHAKFVIFTNIAVDEYLINDADTADLSIVNTGGKLLCMTELCGNLPRYKAILSASVSSGNVFGSSELWEVVHKLYNKQARVLPNKNQLEKILTNLVYLGDLTPYQEFVPQLFLCTKQSDELNLDNLIKQEIHSDKLYEQFMKAVTNWWRTSENYLTRDWKEWTDMFEICRTSIIKPNPLIDFKFSLEHYDPIREKITKRMLLIKSKCAISAQLKCCRPLYQHFAGKCQHSERKC
ncbi:hypothetical protein L9F63_016157, partial [Diploptera punctata]